MSITGIPIRDRAEPQILKVRRVHKENNSERKCGEQYDARESVVLRVIVMMTGPFKAPQLPYGPHNMWKCSIGSGDLDDVQCYRGYAPYSFGLEVLISSTNAEI
jgi:hypothetical protein